MLLCLIHSHDAIRYEPKKTRIYKKSLSMILRIGLPAGLQSSMFSISNVLIQSAINSFGAAAIAGNTAAASIEGFATTLSNALSQAALTFSSQNMGAGKYARVRRVLVVCLAATLIGGLCMGLLIDTFGTPLLALFNTDPDVISCGLIRVSHNMPPLFPVLPSGYICRSAARHRLFSAADRHQSERHLSPAHRLAVYRLRRFPDAGYALSLLSGFVGGNACRARRLLCRRNQETAQGRRVTLCGIFKNCPKRIETAP